MLQTGNTEDKTAIIDTLLNRVVVYKDRVENFINLLSIANTSIDLQMTDKDLTAYGLLEPQHEEKVAQTSDFPSKKMPGLPVGTRTRNNAVGGHRFIQLDYG